MGGREGGRGRRREKKKPSCLTPPLPGSWHLFKNPTELMPPQTMKQFCQSGCSSFFCFSSQSRISTCRTFSSSNCCYTIEFFFFIIKTLYLLLLYNNYVIAQVGVFFLLFLYGSQFGMIVIAAQRDETSLSRD